MITKILRNISAHYLGLLFAGISGLLLTPFLYHRLGVEAFGVLSLCWSISGVLQFLDFGIHGATIKYIAEWKAKADLRRIREFLIVGTLLFFGMGLISAACIIVVSPFVPQWIHAAAVPDSIVQLAFIWSGLGMIWFFPGVILRSFLEGAQRYELSNVSQSFLIAGITISSAFLVWSGRGIVAVSIASAVCYLCHFVLLAVLVLREFPVRERIPLRFSILKEVGWFSLWNFIREIAVRIIWEIDTFLIGIFLSATSVTPYVLARKLPYLLSAAGWRWIEVLMPVASEMGATEKTEELANVFIWASRFALAISICGALLLLFLGEPALALWLGVIPEKTVLVMKLITISILFDLSHAVSNTLLTGLGKLKTVSMYFLLESVLNLTLSIILVQILGIVGVALGTTIAIAFTVVVFQIPYACRQFGLSIGKFLTRVLVPQAVPAAASAILLWLLPRFVPANRWPGLMLAVTIASVAYLLCFWFAGLVEVDRKQFVNRWRGARGFK